MDKPVSQLYLQVLGRVELRASDGVDVTPVLAQPKRLALLIYLSMAGSTTRRDRVMAVFWPELDTDRARAALRDALYFLRRHVGDAIVTRGVHDVGVDPTRLQVDAAQFRNAVAAGDTERAVALYAGDLLDGFHVGGETGFDDWADEERSRLRGQAVDASRTHAHKLAAAGDFESSARVLIAALVYAPYDESLMAELLTAYERRGDPHGGLGEYHRFAERIARDVGTEPTSALAARAASLRSVPGAMTPPATLPAPRPTVVTPGPDPVLNQRGTRPRWVAGALVAAFLIAVAAGPFALRKMFSGGGNPPPAQADIVILPFTIHGAADAAYLAEGFVDLLGAKLDGAGGMRAVDPHALFAVLEGMEGTSPSGRAPDVAVGRAVAARFAAQNFILGSVVAAGPSLQVTVYLYDRGGKLVTRGDGVAAVHADLFGLVDDLARKLLAGRLDAVDAPLDGLAAVTTPSLPALREYLDGERSFRAGDYAAAVSAFERAIERDSTFALAYYRLSGAADWAGRADIAEHAIRTALRLRDRLPYAARDLVTARWEYWLGDARRAETLYRQITASHPTDVESWFELSEVLFHAGPWMGRSLAEAETPLRRVVRLNPGHIAALVHLARVAAYTERLSLVDSLVSAVAAADSAHPRNFEMRALRAGRDPASTDLDALLAGIGLSTDRSLPGAVAERVAVYTGNLAFAERLAHVAAAPGRSVEERSWSLPSLAHILTGQGRWKEASGVLDELARIDRDAAAHVRANLVVSGVIQPAAADMARAYADLTAALPESEGDASAADATHFEALRRTYYLGRLELMRGGSADAAIARLNGPQGSVDSRAFASGHAALLQAHRLDRDGDNAAALRILEERWLAPRKPLMIGWAWSHANTSARLFRASLLERAGRCNDAIPWLDAVYEDIGGSPVLIAEVERIRGVCLESMRRAPAALDAYRAFLALRRTADPDQGNVVRDVEARVRALQAR